MRFKSIMRNLNVLNILLLLTLSLFAYFVLMPMVNARVSYTPPPVKKVAVETKEGDKKAEAPAPPPLNEYVVIAEQNMFHPERKIPVEKKEEAALPKPDFILYGTMVSDSVSIAYMEDKKAPRSTPGRGKRQNSLKTGELLSGYALKEIKYDRVVMARGDDRMEIKVIAQNNKKSRSDAEGPATQQPGQQQNAGRGQVQPDSGVAENNAPYRGGYIPPRRTNEVQQPARPSPSPKAPPAPVSPAGGPLPPAVPALGAGFRFR